MSSLRFSGRLALLAVASVALAVAPSAQQLDLIGELELPSKPAPEREGSGGVPTPARLGGSDVWSYTANDGSEYAIMGDLNGMSIIAVPSMEIVQRVDFASNDCFFYWRDFKTYGSFAYATTECYGENEGLLAVDLRGLPDRVEVAGATRGQDDRLVSSHNISIDTKTGHAYVLNSTGTEIVAVDLSDPLRPKDIGAFPVPSSHDIYARNDTVWVAEGTSPTLSVWDTSDKANPERIALITVPDAGYVHNIWPSDDGKYAVTTEETVDKTIKVWDISDLENPTLIAEWLGDSRLAHNVHWQGDYVFVSHYASGLYILDLSDPSSPLPVAQFDTFPDNDDAAFYGAWGMSLPTREGYVYGSTLEGKLTVLKWTPPSVEM